MQILPLTNRLFQKDTVKEIVIQWIEEVKSYDLGQREKFTEEVIEKNIELFEKIYLNSLKKFVLDIKSFYVATSCYKRILEGREDKLTEEYIAILQKEVRSNFLDEINEIRLK